MRISFSLRDLNRVRDLETFVWSNDGAQPSRLDRLRGSWGALLVRAPDKTRARPYGRALLAAFTWVERRVCRLRPLLDRVRIAVVDRASYRSRRFGPGGAPP